MKRSTRTIDPPAPQTTTLDRTEQALVTALIECVLRELQADPSLGREPGQQSHDEGARDDRDRNCD